MSARVLTDAHSMIVENEEDGVWGSVLQPSQGLFWYRIRDGKLLRDLPRVQRLDRGFLQALPDRLKGIAMLNVDNVEEACEELRRCARWGWSGRLSGRAVAGISVSHPIYERLLWPRKTSIATIVCTFRRRVSECQRTSSPHDSTEMTASGRSTTDYWVRYSMGRCCSPVSSTGYPPLKIGSVEHEASWIPHC